ncbi:MAG: GNAT family N-acetyltransferase [Lysinibacillus sp.]
MNPIFLENDVVQLRPIELSDTEEILEAAIDPEIWTHMSDTLLTKGAVLDYTENAVKEREAGQSHKFVILSKETGKIIGSTTFFDMSSEHKRLEIGYTWLHPRYWRTNINTNCKYLLLTYCFEQWGMHRVQIKTDHENLRSQKAIERLGATKEGVLRNHMIRKDGTIRHTVMYSIIKEDWPEVKRHFEENLLKGMHIR